MFNAFSFAYSIQYCSTTGMHGSPAGLIEIGENGQVQICTEAPPLTFQILLLYMKKFVESNLLECLLLACPTNSNSLYQICDGPDQFLMVWTSQAQTRACLKVLAQTPHRHRPARAAVFCLKVLARTLHKACRTPHGVRADIAETSQPTTRAC